MKVRAAATVSAVLAMLLLAPPAGAWHGYDQPVIHSGGGEGPYWTAYRVHTDGAGVSTHFDVDNPSLPSQLGALIYDGAGRLVFGITAAVVAGQNGALVDVNAVPGFPVHFDSTEPSPDYPFWRTAMNINGFGTANPYVGDLTFVWWTSGERNTGVRHNLGGEPGVEMIGGRECPAGATCGYGPGWESGEETFVFTAKDFVGAANVNAGAGLAAARANVDTSRSVTIGTAMVSSFIGYGTHADRLAVTTPTGRTDCPMNGCFLGSNGPPVGPGTYTFHLSGAGGGPGLTTFGDVVLGGADIRLPAPPAT